MAVMAVIAATLASPAQAEEAAAADPAKVDADFAVQGEYGGQLTRDGKNDGKKQKIGLQVIALGARKFHAVLWAGGLPGDGKPGAAPREEADGETTGEGATAVTTFKHDAWTAAIRLAGKAHAVAFTTPAGRPAGQAKRVERKSPTLGAKPPKGALILFDGKGLDRWETGEKGARMTAEGLLMEGATTKARFGAATYHVEFRTPYEPQHRGQKRGNSGLYIQGRYEAQVLDSFGLAGRNNEAGGIYEVAAPLLNMAFPPLAWQTYDIDFTPAKWEGDKKVANARMTVRLNGVIVQKDTEVPQPTRAAPVEETPEPGPLHLQNHSNPVRYRNVWVLERN
jgi:hypothetical protein